MAAVWPVHAAAVRLHFVLPQTILADYLFHSGYRFNGVVAKRPLNAIWGRNVIFTVEDLHIRADCGMIVVICYNYCRNLNMTVRKPPVVKQN